MKEQGGFEEQFTKTDAQMIREGIMTIAETWPDFLASWDGMITQAETHGWTHEEAKAMVLQTIMPDSTFLVITHRNIEG